MMARLKWCLDPLFHHQLKKTLSKLDPPPPPRTNKTFWLCNHVLCAKSAFMRRGHNVPTTTARDLKAVALKLILRHHAVLRLTILADSLGPDLARQNV